MFFYVFLIFYFSSGNIDETTIEQFRRPRCGVKDILPGDNAGQRSRKKRFTIKGLKWNTRVSLSRSV